MLSWLWPPGSGYKAWRLLSSNRIHTANGSYSHTNTWLNYCLICVSISVFAWSSGCRLGICWNEGCTHDKLCCSKAAYISYCTQYRSFRDRRLHIPSCWAVGTRYRRHQKALGAQPLCLWTWRPRERGMEMLYMTLQFMSRLPYLLIVHSEVMFGYKWLTFLHSTCVGVSWHQWQEQSQPRVIIPSWLPNWSPHTCNSSEIWKTGIDSSDSSQLSGMVA